MTVMTHDTKDSKELKHRVWVLAAKIIGADDEDHEDDELIQPVYDAIMQTVLSYAKGFGRRERRQGYQDAKQEFRKKFHIDPTKSYKIMATESALIARVVDDAQLSQTVSEEANDE
jgi:hypothetical protein